MFFCAVLIVTYLTMMKCYNPAGNSISCVHYIEDIVLSGERCTP
jgi:hypothetical protein